MKILGSSFLFLSIIVFSKFLAFSQPVESQTHAARAAYKKSASTLSKALVREDGRVYACSGNNLFSFETNGSIAWSVHLDYKCDIHTAPVYGGRGKIYLVAENRILRVSFQRNGTLGSAPEVFFDPGETIIGFAVSTLSSSVFVTVKNRGLYAYDMQGQQLWIAGPTFEQFGYRIGCRKDVRDCFFASAPVIDQCEASIYIANTQGEVYSVLLRGPHFRWIQDFSSFDKIFSLTPGNNGLLYVIFPVKSLVLALDAFSGNILWQANVGPLSTSGSIPVVDSNGWISIGSLDGSLYSFSPTGRLKKFPKADKSSDSVIQVDPFLDCSGTGLYISRTRMEKEINHFIGEYTYVSAKKPERAVFTLLVPATGLVYWSDSRPDAISVLLSEKDLQHFVLDERIVLAFIAASKTGNRLQCRSKREKRASSCSLALPNRLDVYVGNERGILLLFLLLESVVLIAFAALVRFCCIFWKKKKLQGQTLGNFLEKRRSLQLKKKQYDRTLTEVRKRAEANETIEEIGDLVRERENIERKLSSTYSLGRDRDRSRSSKSSLLPLYNGKTRSFSFQSTNKESVTIFQTLSDESSTGESSGETEYDTTSSSSGGADDDQEEGNLAYKLKGKMLTEIEGLAGDDGDDVHVRGYRRSPSEPSSSRSERLKRRKTFSSTD